MRRLEVDWRSKRKPAGMRPQSRIASSPCRPSATTTKTSRSRECHAAANWKAFQDDVEWKTVKAKSEENGKLVEKIDSTFLTLTDFSPPPRI